MDPSPFHPHLGQRDLVSVGLPVTVLTVMIPPHPGQDIFRLFGIPVILAGGAEHLPPQPISCLLVPIDRGSYPHDGFADYLSDSFTCQGWIYYFCYFLQCPLYAVYDAKS